MNIKKGPISAYFSKTGLWIRVFGRGVCAFNHRPLFSERNGHRKVLRIRGWGFALLKDKQDNA